MGLKSGYSRVLLEYRSLVPSLRPLFNQNKSKAESLGVALNSESGRAWDYKGKTGR